MRLRPLAIAGVACLALAGCSNASTDATDAAATTAASPAASAGSSLEPLVAEPWALPSPSSSAEAQAIWCSAITQVVSSISTATQTRTGAQKKLNALSTYYNLWTLAEQYGYVTAEEAAVNQTYLEGYQELVTLRADASTVESPRVTEVVTSMNKLTEDSQPLFDSSAAKVTALCNPSAAANPSGDPLPSATSSAG